MRQDVIDSIPYAISFIGALHIMFNKEIKKLMDEIVKTYKVIADNGKTAVCNTLELVREFLNREQTGGCVYEGKDSKVLLQYSKKGLERIDEIKRELSKKSFNSKENLSNFKQLNLFDNEN